jgi:hypothetical protein
VANVKDILAVKKQTPHIEKFYFRKFNELESKQKYHNEVSNRFAALEDLDFDENINSDLETIKVNIKVSAREGKIIRNERSIRHGFMKDAKIIKSKTKLIFSGYRIDAK